MACTVHALLHTTQCAVPADGVAPVHCRWFYHAVGSGILVPTDAFSSIHVCAPPMYPTIHMVVHTTIHTMSTHTYTHACHCHMRTLRVHP
jgi:hypothetical protein